MVYNVCHRNCNSIMVKFSDPKNRETVDRGANDGCLKSLIEV